MYKKRKTDYATRYELHLKKFRIILFTYYHLSHITEDLKRILEPEKFTISVGGFEPEFTIDNLNIVIDHFEVSG
jgi:hypothetical protein